MKSLLEINQIYKSDKGIAHDYLNFYESKFRDYKTSQISILEIGVLFGNSLKLWNDYFQNGLIYGIDDFSQTDGHQFYNHKPVVKEDVIGDISKYERIKIFDMDCENTEKVNIELFENKFKFIIDDANHSIEQQKKNYLTFSKFLTSDGIYFCEDVQSYEDAEELSKFIKIINPNKKIEILEFNLKNKSDDRILMVYE